jgi:hypothetical protein
MKPYEAIQVKFAKYCYSLLKILPYMEDPSE